MNSSAPEMKWHNFLIYLGLRGAALSSAFEAFEQIWFRRLSSETYFLSESAYLLIGAIYALFAIYAVVTRFALARFKKHAPAMLYVTFALNMLLPMAVDIAEYRSAGMQLNPADMGISAAVLAAILALHMIYYRKRAALFIN